MIYNMKNVFRIAAIVCASAWLSSCSTYAHPGTTLYWSVKILANLQQIKGLGLTLKKICKDKDKPFLIYGFAKPIYNTYDREVGRGHHAMVQLFIRKQNINLQVDIDGIMYLLTLKAKLLLTVLTQALVILIKSLTAKIWTKYSMIKLK